MEFIRVLLSDIKSDDEYRISRFYSINDLSDSIKKIGIIETPVLLQNNGLYIIVSGHRRIEAASLLGAFDIHAIVWNDFDYEAYAREAGRKMYHKSAGVIGRINAFCVLSRSADFISNEKKYRQILHIPDEIEINALKKIKTLPPELLMYLDDKDAPLKLVMKINTFDNDFIELLLLWAVSQCRFSIMRIAIDIYQDIRRDSSMMTVFENRKEEFKTFHNDDDILKIIKEIRYPSIAVFSLKAEELKKRYARHGAELNIPIYEEGKQPGISIHIKWSDKGLSYRKTLEFLQKEKIEEILQLL
jgi:ParB-like nuclease domain